MIPGIRLGDISFEKIGFGMIFNRFFQKCSGEVDAGVFDIFREAKKEPAIAAADVEDRVVCLDICQKWFEIRPDVATGGTKIDSDFVVSIFDRFDWFLGSHLFILPRAIGWRIIATSFISIRRHFEYLSNRKRKCSQGSLRKTS